MLCAYLKLNIENEEHRDFIAQAEIAWKTCNAINKEVAEAYETQEWMWECLAKANYPDKELYKLFYGMQRICSEPEKCDFFFYQLTELMKVIAPKVGMEENLNNPNFIKMVEEGTKVANNVELNQIIFDLNAVEAE